MRWFRSPGQDETISTLREQVAYLKQTIETRDRESDTIGRKDPFPPKG